MKRNKKTVFLAHEELTPLTEHVLAKMGQEGDLIRRRLKSFYREKALLNEPAREQTWKSHVIEAAP